MKELSPEDVGRYRDEMQKHWDSTKTEPLAEPWMSRVLWAFFTIDNLRAENERLRRASHSGETT